MNRNWAKCVRTKLDTQKYLGTDKSYQYLVDPPFAKITHTLTQPACNECVWLFSRHTSIGNLELFLPNHQQKLDGSIWCWGSPSNFPPLSKWALHEKQTWDNAACWGWRSTCTPPAVPLCGSAPFILTQIQRNTQQNHPHLSGAAFKRTCSVLSECFCDCLADGFNWHFPSRLGALLPLRPAIEKGHVGDTVQTGVSLLSKRGAAASVWMR